MAATKVYGYVYGGYWGLWICLWRLLRTMDMSMAAVYGHSVIVSACACDSGYRDVQDHPLIHSFRPELIHLFIQFFYNSSVHSVRLEFNCSVIQFGYNSSVYSFSSTRIQLFLHISSSRVQLLSVQQFIHTVRPETHSEFAR